MTFVLHSIKYCCCYYDCLCLLCVDPYTRLVGGNVDCPCFSFICAFIIVFVLSLVALWQSTIHMYCIYLVGRAGRAGRAGRPADGWLSLALSR